MSRPENPLSARALGLLQEAAARLVSRYPFHAGILCRGQFDEEPLISTMGITVREGALIFLYNAVFIAACRLDEVVGILHHEVNHILFDHISADPRQYPDRQARLIAEEVTVNEWVPEPLPGDPITLAQYPELPPNEDTDARYRRLVKLRRSSGAGKFLERTEPLDDHALWQEGGTALLQRISAARLAAREILSGLPAADLKRSSPVMQRILGLMAPGLGSRKRVEAIGSSEGGGARIDWKALLEEHAGAAASLCPVFHRPPRRLPDCTGIFAGTAHRAERPLVQANIDTSSSMSAAGDLAPVGAEVERLARDHEVLVVECDARIQAVYPFKRCLGQVRGRGGTDLRPPLRPEFLARYHPDAVVYFTDGMGPAPPRKPAVPVIWCLTPDGFPPAPWGKVVRLEKAEEPAKISFSSGYRHPLRLPPVLQQVRRAGFDAHFLRVGSQLDGRSRGLAAADPH
ncbi:MAG: hypothetical protein HY717_23135 [Planctomycetes bacterium]|nr:hypothetical protein [Planctomycetota bacterium]